MEIELIKILRDINENLEDIVEELKESNFFKRIDGIK
tara:strand:+ start:224 stop:334 length:111 start_codon:yes stop_codon:yes gene_type:complete